jgi:hypothetical protein
VTFKGVFYEIYVDSEGFEWMIHSTSAPKTGDDVGLSFGPEDIHVMDRPDLFPEGAGAMTMNEIDPEPEYDGDDGDKNGDEI